MGVFLFFNRVPAIVGRVHQFARELFFHRFFAARSGIREDPSDAQGCPPRRPDFHRNLVSRTANAPRLDFKNGLDVLDLLFEKLQRFVAGLFLNDVERVIEDVFGGALFPAPHHTVDEFRHQRALVHGVWHDFPLDDMRFPGHEKNLTIPNFRSRNSKSKFRIELDLPGPPSPGLRRTIGQTFSYPLGRFAPYFERDCLRFATPAASSVPRMTWYRTPGRSLTRPPRIKTIECSCRLWPIPGM